jgi:hypothetical protein
MSSTVSFHMLSLLSGALLAAHREALLHFELPHIETLNQLMHAPPSLSLEEGQTRLRDLLKTHAEARSYAVRLFEGSKNLLSELLADEQNTMGLDPSQPRQRDFPWAKPEFDFPALRIWNESNSFLLERIFRDLRQSPHLIACHEGIFIDSDLAKGVT